MTTQTHQPEAASSQSPVGSAVTVELCRDADVLDAILHHPEVGERTRHDEMPPLAEMTLKPAIEAGRVSALLAKAAGEPAGFWLVIPKGAGVWEVHTNFLPEHRGAFALDAATLAIDLMFTATPAVTLTSFCPECLPESWFFARRNGFKTDFSRPAVWPRAGVRHGVRHVSLTLHEWLREACNRLGIETILSRLLLSGHTAKAQSLAEHWQAIQPAAHAKQPTK